MKNIVLAGVAVLALAATSVVYAQRHDHDLDRGSWWQRMHMTPEDRLAFVDARIAAVKAGLKLTPEQEKNWPAVESAVRDFARQRIENANASVNTTDQAEVDPVTRLRQRADRMAAASAGLKKIADAADPLYKSLDDGQKRRLSFLVHMGDHHHGWRERFGFSHRDGEREHGYRRMEEESGRL